LCFAYAPEAHTACVLALSRVATRLYGSLAAGYRYAIRRRFARYCNAIRGRFFAKCLDLFAKPSNRCVH
jgi:hypothetical protein